MKATLRNVRITPKKANLVAELVRGAEVNDALATLKFTPKKAAKILYKLLNSAVANAENNFKQDPNTLVVKEVKVSKGMRFKRFRPVSRGRAHPINKDCSHIHIILGTKDAAPAVEKKEAPKKETAKKATTKKPAVKKAPAKKTAAKKTTKKVNK